MIYRLYIHGCINYSLKKAGVSKIKCSTLLLFDFKANVACIEGQVIKNKALLVTKASDF